MPTIDHFQAAANRYPNAEAFVTDEKSGSIKEVAAPKLGVFGTSFLGSHKVDYYNGLRETRPVVTNFKKALALKYGDSIADLALEQASSNGKLLTVLSSQTIKKALTAAQRLAQQQLPELKSLLEGAIIDSFEPDKPEESDSAFKSVPGKGTLLFSPKTIAAIKEAYIDDKKTSMDDDSNETAPRPLLEAAHEAIVNDISNAKDPSIDRSFIPPIDLSLEAMRAATANPHVHRALHG